MKLLKCYSILAVVCMSFFSCSRFDFSNWMHKPGKQQCSVQQFNSQAVDATVSPYLFKKTFDAAGLPLTMDAYVPGIFQGQKRFNTRLRYQGNHVYFVDVTSGDTLMKVLLNAKGRPLIAEELTNFYQGQPTFIEPQRYEFTYSGIRLASIKTVRPSFTGTYNMTYDGAGNLISNAAGDVYVYDYTKKADQQFYMDIEFYGPFMPGFWLLQYLEAFPELNSPTHFRIKHTNPVFQVFELFDHKLDSKKKLVAYKGSNAPGVSGGARYSIIWRCKSSGN